MEACRQILDTPAEQRERSRKEGALHVIGQVAETLLAVRMAWITVEPLNVDIMKSGHPDTLACPSVQWNP